MSNNMYALKRIIHSGQSCVSLDESNFYLYSVGNAVWVRKLWSLKRLPSPYDKDSLWRLRRVNFSTYPCELFHPEPSIQKLRRTWRTTKATYKNCTTPAGSGVSRPAPKTFPICVVGLQSKNLARYRESELSYITAGICGGPEPKPTSHMASVILASGPEPQKMSSNVCRPKYTVLGFAL